MDPMNALGVKAEIIILSADAIDSQTKDGKIQGMSVYYTFATSMESQYNNPNSFGMKTAKVWMDHERIQKIIGAPAKYIGTFEMAVGSDGKPVLKLKDMDYKCDVTLTEVIKPKPEDDPNYPQYAPKPEKNVKQDGK